MSLSFRTAIIDPSVLFNLMQFCSSPYYSEAFQDTKGIIKIRNSKTDRQHNDQMTKRTNNDLQNTTQKIKTMSNTGEQHEPHYKPGVKSGAPEGWALPAPLVAPVALSLLHFRYDPKMCNVMSASCFNA